MGMTQTLKENQVVLVLVSSRQYTKAVEKVLKELSKQSLCYVTLNKTAGAVKDSIGKKSKNIDNLVIVDAISRTITDKPEERDDCLFVRSPSALTELSLSISKFLEHDFQYLIFDSLTDLLIYQKESPIAKFASNLISKIKSTNTKAVLFALDLKDHSELIQQISIFADQVVRIE